MCWNSKIHFCVLQISEGNCFSNHIFRIVVEVMNKIAFNERQVGTANPVFTFEDNVISTVGVIVNDGSQPASPAIAANSSYSGPVFISFKKPVSSVSVDVGYFDNLASTRIEFRNAQGSLLQSIHNTAYGVQTFSFSNDSGIASVVAIDESYDAAGFSLDTLLFSAPVNALAAPVVTASSIAGALVDRNFGAVGASTMVFSDSIGGADLYDVVTLNTAASGTASITSYLNDNPDGKSTFTVAVQAGVNAFKITPGAQYETQQPYTIAISLDLNLDAKEKAFDDWIDDTLAQILGLTFNFQSAKFDLIEKVIKNIDNADDAAKLLGKIGEAYGFLGIGLDIADRIDNVAHAADPKKQTFIEVVDFLVGVTSASLIGEGAGLVGTPIAGVLGAFATDIIYTFAISDLVKKSAGDWYDENVSPTPQHFPVHLALDTAPSAAALVDADIDISAVTFDSDYYLNTYSDARMAVLSGEAPSAYIHYITTGALLGYKPNAGAAPISPNQIASYEQGGNAAQGYSSAVFAAAAGTLVGDHLSSEEAAFLDYLNEQRTDGSEFGLDAALATLANRIARDRVINNPTAPAQAYDPAAMNKWASVQSNGKSLADAFVGLQGIPAAMNLAEIKILASFTSKTEAALVFESFMSDPLTSAKLLNLNNRSIGVGEYGGVWIVLLSTASAISEPERDSIPINVRQSGTGGRDILYTGSGKGSLSGLDGADDLFGGQLADTLDGGAGADVITAGPGADLIIGGAGKDILYGGKGMDTLKGGLGDDVLYGGVGADTLNGGVGADTLYGGSDDDIYVIDSIDDVLAENLNEGSDLVNVNIAQEFGIYQLGNNIENAILTNTLAFSLTGNSLDNELKGNAAANTLAGKAGNDLLNGDAGNDILGGGEGNDSLYGGADNDVLIGGDGNDIIRGGNGNDLIYGAAGNDSLTGGAGVDTFVFNTALNGTINLDIITDFNISDDTIQLENSVMTGLGSTVGTLAVGQFHGGTVNIATEDDDRIIYNTTSGALYYDLDGTGSSEAIQIVTVGVDVHPVLTNADFIVV
jgi:Ca2+-binding RTX toxin-like protein